MISLRRKLPDDTLLDRYGPCLLRCLAIAAAAAILLPVALFAMLPALA